MFLLLFPISVVTVFTKPLIKTHGITHSLRVGQVLAIAAIRGESGWIICCELTGTRLAESLLAPPVPQVGKSLGGGYWTYSEDMSFSWCRQDLKRRP